MATPLDTIYASGGEALIVSHELQCDAWPGPIRLVDEYEDLVLGLEDGTAALFEGSGIDFALPKTNASGQQTMRFAIDNVRGEAQQLIDLAIEAGARVVMIARKYAGDDLSAPLERPMRFTVHSSAMAMNTVRLEAGFFDMLGRRWPIHFYTADEFPGVTYMV
ncbi:protein of unknown function [Halopseudomonas litoralis]|uniref:DUF1833 domain-containing protein n=1 Tax=Halopseudomonas litoralis TaxID=797277 RepID=A0A1H1NZ25_9GAMM|nr:DUF1833 family protein [Halopseudomonas litoralis]SDS04025.1 protein of unknown function [Halopseudomonas litoralis]